MSSAVQTDEYAALTQQVADLRAEGAELAAKLADLNTAEWSLRTTFKQWTVWDVVAHLHLSDHMGITSLQGEAPFRALMHSMRDARVPMAAFARRWLGDISGPELLSRWQLLLQDLCDQLAATDPAQRLPWAGPSMKPRMFTTARQMETWAHGWEIWDLFGGDRPASDRLYNVATIGVRTFGWTFANRGVEPPGQPPRVELIAPSGARWIWNEGQLEDSVQGSAVEFCQVVTQVRNIADTALVVNGAVAQQWMAIAQCFAGPPADPPLPGTRHPAETHRP
ncbi:MAG: TIGR03084 family metal-binding protein [Pseudomonadales bacterium]